MAMHNELVIIHAQIGIMKVPFSRIYDPFSM